MADAPLVTRPPGVRPPSRVVGVAAPAVLSRLLVPRTVPVLHAGVAAAYLDLGGTCVGVLARGAARLPCGVVTGLATVPHPGRVVRVGGGSVVLGDLTVRVRAAEAGTVPTVPRVTADDAGWAGALTAPWRPAAAAAELLPSRALDRLHAGDPASVPLLLGLGQGLTPLGDDVLAGWLATAAATGDVRGPAVAAALDGAVDSTTLLSATLLRCAAAGETLPEVRSLLGAAVRRDEAALTRAAARLAGIGDTSGAGLLLGIRSALTGRGGR